jgi:hypothetical protein
MAMASRSSKKRQVAQDVLLQEPNHRGEVFRRQELGELLEAEGLPIDHKSPLQDIGQVKEVGAAIQD